MNSPLQTTDRPYPLSPKRNASHHATGNVTGNVTGNRLHSLLAIAPLRILVISHDASVQAGVKRILSPYSQLKTVGRLAFANEGLILARQLCPDVIILDANSTPPNAIELLRSMKLDLPMIRILALVQPNHPSHSEETIADLVQQVNGCCDRTMELKTLLVAIACIQDGGVYLDAQIARRITQHLRPVTSRKLAIDLSQRELDVLQLLVKGRSNPEIAATLYLSLSTVKSHIRNIMNKFAVDDRVQAAVIAMRMGLVY